MSRASVPTTAVVRPGAAVHIVLKADQSTGRTVSGTVKDVLTRGDHPRGIKVRLADGRIGRVQGLASGDQPAEPTVAGDEQGAGPYPPISPLVASSRAGARSRDARQREGEEPPRQEIALGAYLRPVKAQGRGRRKGGRAAGQGLDASAQGEAATAEGDEGDGGDLPAPGPRDDAVVCPVCEAFEGDAAAVAHHVASHFDS